MDRFLIAPFNSGLQSNLKSWLLPEDAFTTLQNAYVWRGRVKKRFGSRFMGNGWTSNITEQLYSRLRLQVGTTSGGSLAGTVPGSIFEVGQQFSVGNYIFTVVSSTSGVQPMLSSGTTIGTTSSTGTASGTFSGATTGQSFNIAGTIFTVSGVGLNPFTVTGLGMGTGTYNTVSGAYTFTGVKPLSSINYTLGSGTFDVSDGDFAITGTYAAATPVWFYPALPVMGLETYGDNGTPVNDQSSYAWDTQFSYVFYNGYWQASAATNPPLWHGDDLNFFWSCNWQGISDNPVVLFTTNFQVANPNGAPTGTDDPIWYFYLPTGSNPGNGVWTAASGTNAFYTGPAGGPPQTGAFVVSAKIIVPFKNRLLLLNTIENQGTSFGVTDGSGNATGKAFGFTIGQFFTIGTTTFTVATLGNAANALTVSAGGTGTGTYNSVTGAFVFTGASATTAITANGLNTNFVSRVRFCHYGSPFSPNAWYESNQTDNAKGVGDGGNYNDAATEEEIISVEFIKDRLIVFFERSTWELAYTGNAVQPFQWQKINTELGSESTFSSVPFDKQILTVGNTGVHACTGPNVQRIDVKIPDEVFQIANKNAGVQRVYGVRDYFAEMVYWTFPSDNENSIEDYPNKVLAYNYENGSWSFNDDCLTCFGYFEQQLPTTWASSTGTWQESNFPWNSGTTQAQFRQVIAGNQEGYVVIIDASENRNERCMQITNLNYHSSGIVQLVIVDHTLEVGSWISIENAQGLSFVQPNLFYEVISVIDANTIWIGTTNISGVYLGGGNAARISNIQITSKQWNPYVSQDRNVHLAKIDFGVLRTETGSIVVDYSPSSSSISMINDGGPTGTNSMVGTNILETSPYDVSLAPLEQSQEHLWHPIYFQSDGTCIQIEMYFNDEMMADPFTAWAPFEIQGIVLYTQQTTARLQ